MKPYAKVKGNWESSYSCFSIFWELEQVREIGSKCPKSWASMHRKSFKVLNPTFHIKWSLIQIQIPSEGSFIPALVYLGHWRKSSKLVTNVPSHGHVIQRVNLHILHQMKPYSNAKAIWELIYTCFYVSVEVEQVREIGPK